MYESHYGMSAKPFSIVPNPEILFLSKNHEDALRYLEYGLNEKVGFILLTGEIGAGKTTLIRYMLNKIEAKIETAVIFNTSFSPDHLFKRILSEFDIPCDTTEKEGHLTQLYQYLIDQYASGRSPLLIIDEAQNLSDDALEDIRMLSHLQTDDQILLQIMLVGQPELKTRLSKPDFRQLAQRIAVNYHITPLDKQQTRHYIDYRIQKAGGMPDLFSPEAIERVYRHSGGIPRTINLMCDTALVYGFSDNRKQIDEATIEKVIEDKICMSVSEENTVGRTVEQGVSPSDAGPGVMERIHALEVSLNNLRQQYKNFTQVVKNDLIGKYQQLLLTEQHRYDQLMEKYTQLLQTNHAPEPSGMAEGNSAPTDEPPQKYKSGTKFAHLLKLAEKAKASDKEN